MIDPETDHLMTRASEEAVRAIQAGHPAAARAHHGLAVRYSTKAVIALVGEADTPNAAEKVTQFRAELAGPR